MDNYSLAERLTKIYGDLGDHSNHSIYLPPKFKVNCVQSTAHYEFMRASVLPVSTPVTLTHAVTGVRWDVKNLDTHFPHLFLHANYSTLWI